MGRAKCKLCNDIIESKHRHDYVTCSCGEISVDGGQDYFRARFNNPENFLCVDDEGNEIIPKHKEATEPLIDEVAEREAQEQWEKERNTPRFHSDSILDQIQKVQADLILPKPDKNEILSRLDELIKRIDDLPQEARYAPINHADFASLLTILASFLRAN